MNLINYENHSFFHGKIILIFIFTKKKNKKNFFFLKIRYNIHKYVLSSYYFFDNKSSNGEGNLFNNCNFGWF